MWYGVGGFAVFIYFILIVTFGLETLKKGHWVLFFLGFPLPLFWILGTFLPSKAQAG